MSTIPDRWFPVERYGAVADGSTDCTAAFRRAVVDCHRAGGGHVVATCGTFRTGPVQLLDDVGLHVSSDAVISFIADPARYLPAVLTRWQGIEYFGYSPLIYAHGRRNIAVTGDGTLDGGAGPDSWWPWSGRAEFGWEPGIRTQEDDWPTLWELAERGVPVRSRISDPPLRFRPSFIEPYACRDVLISGVRIVRSPSWVIHPTLSSNVVVRDVTVDSTGPNNDGCDPESCDGVVIRGCRFVTGDDAIAVKSGREADGRRIGIPCSDIVIDDCDLVSRYGGIALGSELTGGISNVLVSRCRLGPDLYFGLYIKTNSVRGGYVRNIRLSDLSVRGLAKEFLSCDFYRGEGASGEHSPDVSDISLSRVSVSGARRVLLCKGYPHAPIRDIRLSDCTFSDIALPDILENVDGLIR